MATSDHFGSWLRKVLAIGQSRFGANTFRGEGEAVREEAGKKGREREGEEQRGEVEQEKKEKKGHREARSGEPDSMRRLAKEGRNEEVGEETRQVQRGRGGTKEGYGRREEESTEKGAQGEKEREKRCKLDSSRDKTIAN